MLSKEEESIEEWVLSRVRSMCEVSWGRVASIGVMVHPETLHEILAAVHKKDEPPLLLSPDWDGHHTIDTPYARVHFEISRYSVETGTMRRMVSPEQVYAIEEKNLADPFRPPYERTSCSRLGNRYSLA